jgi:DNA-binding CsgD family transcriptional regulator
MHDLKSKSARQANSKFLVHYPRCQPGEKEKTRILMLTNREKDVLALAGRGLTNQDIGEKLEISSRTVKCILHHACIKLRAHNRTQALLMAISKGYISIKEVISVDELANLLASLDPEVIDSVNQRLKLKDEKPASLSGRECLLHPENKRLLTTVATSNLSARHSNPGS